MYWQTFGLSHLKQIKIAPKICSISFCTLLFVYCKINYVANNLKFQPRMARKQVTPVNSPQKEKYGDRFIPSRAGNNWQTSFSLIQVKNVFLRPFWKTLFFVTVLNKYIFKIFKYERIY